MNISTFKGYLLEDVILKLIESNGFELIKKLSDSPNDLIHRGNGVNIIGRGGTHQFDSLGKFKWTVPFTYPIRLFVEAKFFSSSHPVEISVVRNGMAILLDLNQNTSTVELDNQHLMLPSYNYQYVIFSTSGFSNPAIRLALAHNIFLIDISESNYNMIIDYINESINMIKNEFPEKFNPTLTSISKESAREIRELIRISLGIILRENPLDGDRENTLFNFINSQRFPIKKLVNDLGGLYLASINSVYTIVLKPENNDNFLNSVRKKPSQKIEITRGDNPSESWTISNSCECRNDLNLEFFKLKFFLPKLISKYIFEETNLENIDSVAVQTKENIFSNINLIVMDNDKPIMCTLKFDLVATNFILGSDSV